MPTNTSQTGERLYTYIGVYVGNYTSALSYPFYVAAYWFGDGTIRDDDNNIISSYSATSLEQTNITINAEQMEEYTASDIAYSAQIIEGASTKSSSEKYTDTMLLEVNCNDSAELATLPVIAIDQNFEHCLDIGLEDITFLEDNCLSVNLENARSYETLYVKMPNISVYDDSVSLLAEELDGINAESCTVETDAGNTVRLLKLSYDAEDLPFIPHYATLIADEEIGALAYDTFSDDTGNVTRGSMTFAIPDDYELPDTYTLLLDGELTIIEGAIIEVSTAG